MHLQKIKEVVIDLPMPEGRFEKFEIVYSPIMEAGLAAKYPHIRSYRAYSMENPKNRARFTVGAKGLSASIMTDKGDVYIDPYAIGETNYYISYYIKHDQTGYELNFSCGTQDAIGESHHDQEFLDELQLSLKSGSESVELRRYRIAISCTGEWGAVQGSVANAIETMALAVDRANLIYENELSIIYMLVDNNDELVFLDGTDDPFPEATNAPGLIGMNTSVVNNIIGVNSYDIGHIFTRICTNPSVGGIASLGSLCGPIKASGCTCWFGSTSPNNGIIGTFTHEMGHQMSANHSFNHCDAENENPPTGYEVGSGSTIMSYSGGCGSLNTGDNFDRYHVGSIQEIYLHTRNGGPGDCGVKEDIGNHAPEASHDYTDGFNIPIDTPFYLEGSAFDCDGDDMTYSWEQFDTGPLYTPGNPIANVPLFETYALTTEKTRWFPKLNTVYGNGTDFFEYLPDYSRDLTFRFVVRDNHPGGGTVDWADVEFMSTEEAGPFTVLYPNNPETFEIGQEVEVLWDVANTDGDLVNCQNVDIYLSTQPNQPWFDNLLASNVPNDGSQIVTIPNTPAPFVRIVVMAHNNIFYDMGNIDSKIIEPTDPTYFVDVFPKTQDICLPESASFQIESAAFGGFSDEASYSVVSGLPAGAVANFSNNNADPNEDITLDIDLSGASGSGTFNILLEAVAGSTTIQKEVSLNITGVDFSSLEVISPAPNQAGVGSVPTLQWVDVQDATSYDVQLATSPSFEASSIFLDVEGVTSSQYNFTDLLEKNTLYYWRVKANNKCKSGEFTPTQAFGTETLNCNIGTSSNLPLNISQSGTPTIEATFPVTSTGTVVDVAVTKMKGLHDKVSDIAGILVSPSGTEVILWEEKCSNSSNYNLGFNDDSPTEVICPINTGNSYKPVVPLSTFAGEDAQGVWKLRIEDRDPGNGGTFDEAEIEICSNASLDPPSLINNNTLGVPPASGQLIQNSFLLATDPDNTNDELVYTVVDNTKEGIVYLNGIAQEIGSQFTQADLDEGRVRYVHDAASSATSDVFTFTITDGNGGWIGITAFNIEIDESFTSSVEDIADVSIVQIYPNPTANTVFIDFKDWDGTFYKLNVYGIDGKSLISKTLDQKRTELNIEHLTNGIYLFELSNGAQRYQTSILKQD